MVECELYDKVTVVVLIDTWWNVNTWMRGSHLQEGLSFNRYMVECEWAYQLYDLFFPFVLIDTWWNVNVSAAGQAGEWEDTF